MSGFELNVNLKCCKLLVNLSPIYVFITTTYTRHADCVNNTNE